jgi:hypothetical protein
VVLLGIGCGATSRGPQNCEQKTAGDPLGPVAESCPEAAPKVRLEPGEIITGPLFRGVIECAGCRVAGRRIQPARMWWPARDAKIMRRADPDAQLRQSGQASPVGALGL